MTWRSVGLATLAWIGWSGAALADERDFYTDRPGKDTPSCTLDPGRLQIEASVDFTTAWQPSKNSEIDLSTYVGVNHATPRIELAVGTARRF